MLIYKNETFTKIKMKIYLDPINNFSEIVNLAMYFENIEELDYSSEAVASIQQLDDDIIANMLIKDFQNRDKESIKNYGYQRLWWSLINTEKTSVYTIIKSNINEPIIDMFNYWLKEELDPDVDTYHNILKIL